MGVLDPRIHLDWIGGARLYSLFLWSESETMESASEDFLTPSEGQAQVAVR